MDAHNSAKGQSQKQFTLTATIAITIAITIVMAIFSMVTGGFGSRSAAVSDYSISLAILIHLSTAIPALLIGPFILLRRRKGDKLHRWFGRAWFVFMIVTALASAFIRSPGSGILGSGFSFIHVFTVWTLVMAPLGIVYARKGRIATHRGIMTGLYAGLVIAGAFTLLPGRLLNTVIFG